MSEVTEKTIEALLQHPEEGATLLRASLKKFIKVFFYYVYRKQFTFKPFHDELVGKLEDIVFGRAEKKNLYIGISPRFGKSVISQLFVAWCYTMNKDCNFIMVSYGDKLVLKFSGQSKSIISSELYQKLFEIKCQQDTTAKDLWKIDGGGEFRATSMRGVITGFGAGTKQDIFGGALIIDDYLKADNFKSTIEKQNCVDVYTNTLKSRLNSPDTPIIIIAQRLATDDLVGWLEKNEPDDWDFFVVPTLDENGESIWEEQMPAKTLIKMRDTNPFLFYSQYQQNPIVLGGTVIKEEWFRFYPNYKNALYKRLFMTADTALKVKEANDFTAIGMWGITTNNELYLLDMIHGKWEAPDLERQFISFWNKWRTGVGGIKTNSVYIEDKASGTGLIQSIRRKGGIPVIPIEPEKDKLTRVMDVSPYIESGLLYLPMSKEYEISKKLISECTAFTADDRHEHDDMVDMMTMALTVAYRKSPMRINSNWETELNALDYDD